MQRSLRSRRNDDQHGAEGHGVGRVAENDATSDVTDGLMIADARSLRTVLDRPWQLGLKNRGAMTARDCSIRKARAAESLNNDMQPKFSRSLPRKFEIQKLNPLLQARRGVLQPLQHHPRKRTAILPPLANRVAAPLLAFKSPIDSDLTIGRCGVDISGVGDAPQRQR